MRVLILLVITMATVWSCKPAAGTDTSSESGGASDAKTLEVQVMAVHDEVMPRINEIGHLSAQLRNIRSALKETPEGKIEAPAGLDDALKDLKLAEQAMWDWMNAYTDTKSTLTEDQLIPFLEKQMEAIQKVKADIDSSIANAQAWIKAHPSN